MTAEYRTGKRLALSTNAGVAVEIPLPNVGQVHSRKRWRHIHCGMTLTKGGDNFKTSVETFSQTDRKSDKVRHKDPDIF